MQYQDVRTGEMYCYRGEIVQVAAKQPAGNWGKGLVVVAFPVIRRDACVVSAEELEPVTIS